MSGDGIRLRREQILLIRAEATLIWVDHILSVEQVSCCLQVHVFMQRLSDLLHSDNTSLNQVCAVTCVLKIFFFIYLMCGG